MKEISALFYFFYMLLCCSLFLSIDSDYLSYYLFFPVVWFLSFVFLKKINNMTVDWFSIDVIFVFMFFLIHFGYLFCYELGYVDYEEEVFWSSLHMNSTILLATGAISSYLCGFSIISPKTEYNAMVFYSRYDDYLWFFGKVMLFIVLAMFWLPILSILNLAISDYSSLIQVGTLSSIGKLYWLGQYLAVFALFFIFYFSFKYKIKNSLFFYLGLFYVVSYFLIGDRGGFLFYVVIPVVLYHYLCKQINIKKMSIYILLILFLSALVGVSRVSSTYNPIEAYKLYQEADKKNNPIVEALSEFGKSIKTVNIVVANFPERYDYLYGKSYLDSFLIVFPSVFSTRTSQGVDVWVTETFFGKNTYGRGGSMLMESYSNFGLYGSMIFFNLLGMLSGYLYKKIKKSPSLLVMLVYVSFAAVICIWMRNTSGYVFRTMIWTVTIYYLVIAAARLKKSEFKN